MSGLSRVRVPKAAELVASTLRRKIIDGSFTEGTVLPSEAELMQQFDVSRPTLREAIRVLEGERLLRVRRGARGGAVVTGMQSEVVSRYAALLLEARGTTLDDVYEAQATFEPACVARLALSSTPDIVARLRQALTDEEARLGSEEELVDRVGFHAVLIELSGSQTLHLVSEIITGLLVAVGGREPVGIDGVLALRDHKQVVDFIEAGDANSARLLWETHLASARSKAIERMGPDFRVQNVFG